MLRNFVSRTDRFVPGGSLPEGPVFAPFFGFFFFFFRSIHLGY